MLIASAALIALAGGHDQEIVQFYAVSVFAGFLAASITGNLSGLDVDCEPQFPITRFIDRTGAITNCGEPAALHNEKP